MIIDLCKIAENTSAYDKSRKCLFQELYPLFYTETTPRENGRKNHFRTRVSDDNGNGENTQTPGSTDENKRPLAQFYTMVSALSIRFLRVFMRG